MHVGSVSRILAKRTVLQTAQAKLAAFIGTPAFGQLPASQQANLTQQNAHALGKIGTMNAKLQRKTGKH